MASTGDPSLLHQRTQPSQAGDTTPAASTPSSERLLIALCLAALYVIWGSTYFAIRIALESFPPFLMAGARFTLAGAVMYLFLRLRGAPTPRWSQWLGASLVGVLLLALGNGCVVFAEQSVASGLAAVVIASVPLWSALFDGLWGNWPGRREWLGLAAGLIGIAVLNSQSDLRANPLGALLLLFAAVSWAAGSVWSHHLPMPKGLISSAVQMLAGGGVLLLLSAVRGERIHEMPASKPTLALAYLLVFGSLIAFSAYGYLLNKVPPTLATSYAYVNPVVAVLLGIVLAHERIAAGGFFAMVLILMGVGLLASKRTTH